MECAFEYNLEITNPPIQYHHFFHGPSVIKKFQHDASSLHSALQGIISRHVKQHDVLVINFGHHVDEGKLGKSWEGVYKLAMELLVNELDQNVERGALDPPARHENRLPLEWFGRVVSVRPEVTAKLTML